MASDNVKTVTDSNFEAEVVRSTQPVLIDFTATWCGPCKAIAPIVEGLADTYSGRLKVAKLDIDQSPETPARLGIRGVPTLIVFHNGREIGRQVGAAPKFKIEAFVTDLLAQHASS